MGFRVLISEAFELYRREVIVYLNQSKRTEEQSQCAMKSFVRFAGDRKMSEIDFDTIRKWKEHMERSMSPNTVRGYVLKIRNVFKHLSLSGYDVLNYQKIGVPKRRLAVVEFLTPDEVTKYIDAALIPTRSSQQHTRLRNAAIIALLYASGIRVSELVNLDRTFIRDGMESFTVMGKGGKTRLCFIDERAKFYIREYLNTRKDNNPALFIGRFGDRFTKNSVEIMFTQTNKMANMDVHPHMLRHSFATNMLRNNTNLLYVSKFLGHSSVQTTEMYTHIVDEDLRAIYKQKHTI